MSEKDNGGPAFPAQFFDERATGMTMRDYFAAKVMQGMVIATHVRAADVAAAAYDLADCMLEARKK